MSSGIEGRTICAVSSPAGGGGRGVIRISGPECGELVRRSVRVAGRAVVLGERDLVRGRFLDGVGEQPVLLLWMPGPRSYTREDVAELHLPGAPPLLERALLRLIELGARAAGPGEFTRRAFESGRIDLTRAEGVLELVEASGEAERRAAAQLVGGGLARRVEPLRAELEELRALCEASLDFDESDSGHVPEAELRRAFGALERGLDEALGWEVGRTSASGRPRIALVGAPNAGKSTLFNRLVGAGSRSGAPALVADVAGTTRDGLEGTWTVGGVVCELLDAPGLDPGAAGADARAQELAGRERAGADLLLWVVDASRRAPEGSRSELELLAESASGAPRVLVWSKLDRDGAAPSPPEVLRAAVASWVGASQDDGSTAGRIADTVAATLGFLDGRYAGFGGGADGLGRQIGARHRASLVEARGALLGARDALDAGAPLDLVAEALREATAALDGISGATTPEGILDRIFARFCLGK